MERNRWDRAIRCLEIALHPNTEDDEVVAGVNGFRRTADGTPLSEICREFALGDQDNRGSIGSREWKEKVDALSRENLDLRHRLEIADNDRVAVARQLQETERRVRELDEELQAAQHRVSLAERQVAEFQAARAWTAEEISQENFDLPEELVAGAQSVPEPRVPEPVRPFREFLTAASLRAKHVDTSISDHHTAPDPRSDLTNVALNPRRPWTA
jgi:Tfp pilus assembly protein FimV